MTFTFVKTASASIAAVGDTVEYTYCGQNTSAIPLTIVRLVADRLGVVLEGDAVVAPGATLCHTDVADVVTYTIPEADAGSVINNNTVVTVRTQEAEPREFQATAAAAVAAVPRLSRDVLLRDVLPLPQVTLAPTSNSRCLPPP